MQKVQAKIHAMSKLPDVHFEQCSHANLEFKVNNADTIPEVQVVGNTFVSLAAYQNKGYAYIPIDWILQGPEDGDIPKENK